MKTNWSLGLTLIVMGALLWTPSTPADHHRGQGNWLEQISPHELDPELRRLLRGLELSEAQRQVISLMIAEAENERQLAGEAFEKQIQAHMALLGQPDFDERAAGALVTARQANDFDTAVARLRLQHRVMQVLTEQQRAEVAERAMARIERYRYHHGEKKHRDNKA